MVSQTGGAYRCLHFKKEEHRFNASSSSSSEQGDNMGCILIANIVTDETIEGPKDTIVLIWEEPFPRTLRK